MQIPITKNQVIDLSIHALGTNGEGIGRYEGFAVFVQGALPDERVRAHIIKVNKRYAIGKLQEVLMPSPHRVAPRCPVFAQCGGCALQHLSYPAQLQHKQQHIGDCFKRIGGLEADSLPVLGMEEPWRYRNKGAFPVAPDLTVGFFAPRSHRVIPIADCPLHPQAFGKLTALVQDWAKAYGIAGYCEETHSGILRHILMRQNKKGEVLLALVTRKPAPHTDKLVQAVREQAPYVVGILENENPARTNVILGQKVRVLWGAERLEEQIMGQDFSVSLHSFLQVNPIQTEKLYQTALDAAQLDGAQFVLDAYCGIGTMSLMFARHAKEVIGVECVPQAIADANENAKRNGIANASFIEGLSEEVLPRLWAQGVRPDVLVLDPPRKGCDQSLMEAISRTEIPRIVYVSCDPATLARDVGLLAQAGYAVQKVQGVDMFPQTGHVETVCLLNRKDLRK